MCALLDFPFALSSARFTSYLFRLFSADGFLMKYLVVFYRFEGKMFTICINLYSLLYNFVKQNAVEAFAMDRMVCDGWSKYT
jgi:hypothetical protein